MKNWILARKANYAYNIVMKFLAFACLLLLLAPLSARADIAVSVFLYKADPTVPEGFSQVYRWRMDKSDEFRRFEYLTTKMKKGDKEKLNPYTAKPAEMLVLSVKDENGITGKDYYMTPQGIMITSSTAHNRYFEDTNNFFTFLKEETLHHNTSEKYAGEKIAPDSPGLVVRYLINQSLPDPAWLVNTQKNVNLYDSFMRKTVEIGNKGFLINNPFEDKGNFVLMLNYPKAPGKYMMVNKYGMRLSNTYSEDSFVVDDKKYYKFFYDLTRDNMSMDSRTKAADKQKEDKGNF